MPRSPGLTGFLLAFLVFCLASLPCHALMENNAAQHMLLAQQYAEANQLENAVSEYQIAIQLSPHSALSASLFNNLGLCFLKLGQTQQAIASFQHAIRIQPGFELYYVNLVKAYQQSRQLPLARQKLFALVDKNPYNAEAWYLIGLVYEQIEDYEAAKSSFKAYLKLQPNSRLAAAAKRHL